MSSIYTFRNGVPIITPDTAGGVFLGVHRQDIGAPLVKTFYNAVGLELRVYQVYAGSFAWSTGRDSSGNPQIYFSARPKMTYMGSSTLLVFAA